MHWFVIGTNDHLFSCFTSAAKKLKRLWQTLGKFFASLFLQKLLLNYVGMENIYLFGPCISFLFSPNTENQWCTLFAYLFYGSVTDHTWVAYPLGTTITRIWIPNVPFLVEFRTTFLNAPIGRAATFTGFSNRHVLKFRNSRGAVGADWCFGTKLWVALTFGFVWTSTDIFFGNCVNNHATFVTTTF